MLPARVNIDSIALTIRDFLGSLVLWVSNGETSFENQVRRETSVRVGAIMGIPVAKVVNPNNDQLFSKLSVWLTVHQST
jgi:hypothetical protein